MYSSCPTLSHLSARLNVGRACYVIFEHSIVRRQGCYVIKRQSKGKSERQQATQQRKAAVKALQKWMSDFLYIARHALKDDKQQLEALGQVV